MSEGADGEKSEPHSSSETAKVNEGGIVEKTIPRNSELCILTTAKMPKLKMDKKSSIDDETYFFLIVWESWFDEHFHSVTEYTEEWNLICLIRDIDLPTLFV